MNTEQLLDHLLRISDALAGDMDRYLRGLGLTPVKAHLLWVLHGSGAARQRELATALGHTPRHVTTLVDELITAGQVTRRPHPEDRRAVLIELTPAAVRLLDEMTAERTVLAEQLFGHLPSGERTQLGRRLADLDQTLAVLIEAQDS